VEMPWAATQGSRLAEAEPEVVVAAAGQGAAVAVAQQVIGGQDRAAIGASIQRRNASVRRPSRRAAWLMP
jgi:hypothetical protein